MSSLYHIPNNQFTFINEPIRKDIKYYEEAMNSLIGRMCKIDGVSAVYKSGKEVSVLGISDIDIIVVLKDEIRNSKELREALNEAIKGYESILELDIMDKKTFKRYYDIFPSRKKLFKVYGENINVEPKLNPDHISAYLVDSLNKIYPHEFLDIFFFPKIQTEKRLLNIILDDFSPFMPRRVYRKYVIDTAHLIHRLNAFKNDLSLSEEIFQPRQEWKEYMGSVEKLRENWFTLNRNKRGMLLNVLRKTVPICFDFVEAISEYLNDRGLQIEGVEGILNVNIPGFHQVYPNVYTKNWVKEYAYKKSIHNFKNLRMRSCVLPSNLALNECIRKGMIVGDKKYVKNLLEREEAIRTRMEYLSRYKFHPLRNSYLYFLKWLYNIKAKFILNISNKELP